MDADDVIVSAVSESRLGSTKAGLLTVELAETSSSASLASTPDTAVTSTMPVVKMLPPCGFGTVMESTLSLSLYGGGAEPEAVGCGPLATLIGGVVATVTLIDSPKAELLADAPGVA
jgi:hypothetical protein